MIKPVAGKWFAGWGFMRYWEFERAAATPRAQGRSSVEGEGSEADYPGVVDPASWRWPHRATLSFLSAIPRSAVYH